MSNSKNNEEFAYEYQEGTAMVTIQHRNVITGVLVAVVAVLSALVVVTSIAQMYGATVGLILGQLMSLSAIGYVYIKAREQKNELFCAQLTVSK